MRTCRAILLRTCLAVSGVVLLHGAAQAADALSVCIDKTSPTAEGDRKLAEAVANQLHATLATHMFDGSGDGDDGFDIKDFRKLLAADCEIVLGFPSEADNASLPPETAATSPYGSTGFVLVLADGMTAHTLSDLPEGTEVAVTYGTAPNLFLVSHANLKPDLLSSDQETLKTLQSGDVKAAMIWHPTLAATPGTGHFSVHPLTERHAGWNLVALTKPDAPVAARFEGAITALQTSGDLARLLAPYGIDAAPEKHAAIEPPPRVILAAFSPQPSDAPPALFTASQAKQGAAKFADNCAQCHGDNLEGMAGPALKGPNFASEKSAFKVSDIFTILVNNMPATQPGSLAHDDYVQIMAYLLQQNGYPAGSSELTFDGAGKSMVPLVYKGR